MFSDDADQLMDHILHYAKHFLTEADEFYPFGAVIQHDGRLRSVGISMEEEHPNCKVVLTELESALKEALARDVYRAAAVGLDVYIKPQQADKLHEKTTAIQVTVYSRTSSLIKYFAYRKQASGYEFEECSIDG